MRAPRLLLAVLLAALASLLLVGVTYAAFTAQTTNEGDAFAGGTVILTDTDGGSALFAASGLTPASAAIVRCVEVRYSGSLAAEVRLWGTNQAGSRGDLAPELTLTVERGTQTTPTATCTSFTASTGGTVYTGLLSALPADWATGRPDPLGETWAAGKAVSYRMTLAPRAGATPAGVQGRSTLFRLVWEARNL